VVRRPTETSYLLTTRTPLLTQQEAPCLACSCSVPSPLLFLLVVLPFFPPLFPKAEGIAQPLSPSGPRLHLVSHFLKRSGSPQPSPATGWRLATAPCSRCGRKGSSEAHGQPVARPVILHVELQVAPHARAQRA
jgi:hypothetical protein